MVTKIHTETLGQGQDLILLHGWAFHSGIYRSLAQELSLYYRVTSVDLPGLGRSRPWEHQYDLPSLARGILSVVPEKAIWMGWSLGGLISLWIARHFPLRIHRLITVCCSPKFISSKNWPGMAIKNLIHFSNNLQQNYYQTLLRFLMLQCMQTENVKIKVKILSKELFRFSAPDLDALQGGLNILKKTDLRPDLEKIVCPTLHILGEQDTLVPIALGKLLQERMPMSTVGIIAGSGHIPFFSHEKEFLSRVKCFLT